MKKDADKNLEQKKDFCIDRVEIKNVEMMSGTYEEQIFIYFQSKLEVQDEDFEEYQVVSPIISSGDQAYNFFFHLKFLSVAKKFDYNVTSEDTTVDKTYVVCTRKESKFSVSDIISELKEIFPSFEDKFDNAKRVPSSCRTIISPAQFLKDKNYREKVISSQNKIPMPSM